MKFVIVIAAAVLLVGCVNDYAKFYRSTPGATPGAIASTRAAPPPVVPKLDESGDTAKKIVKAYGRYGYVPIGYSSFSSGHSESEENALNQGKKVGADVVVVMNPRFAGSRSTVIPWTTPTSQTSYTSGSATAYGSGGSVTAYGNSVTTTYGSKTNYIPMTINRYNYGAIYFIKQKYKLGITSRNLTDTERQEFQTNRAVYVLSVVDGSPAFNNDILPGDVILGVNGQAPSGQAGVIRMIKGYKGKTITLTIARSGKRIQKTIQLGR